LKEIISTQIKYESIATAVCTFGDDVYAGGSYGKDENAKSVLWKNGVKQELSTKKSLVISVFIK
jgi:hypothetical protein